MKKLILSLLIVLTVSCNSTGQKEDSQVDSLAYYTHAFWVCDDIRGWNMRFTWDFAQKPDPDSTMALFYLNRWKEYGDSTLYYHNQIKRLAKTPYDVPDYDFARRIPNASQIIDVYRKIGKVYEHKD